MTGRRVTKHGVQIYVMTPPARALTAVASNGCHQRELWRVARLSKGLKCRGRSCSENQQQNWVLECTLSPTSKRVRYSRLEQPASAKVTLGQALGDLRQKPAKRGTGSFAQSILLSEWPGRRRRSRPESWHLYPPFVSFQESVLLNPQ